MAALRQQFIPLDDVAGWRAALDGVPHAYAHTHGHARAISLTTQSAPMLYVAEGDGGRVVCPLIERADERARELVTPYGFSGLVGVGEVAGFFDRFRAFAAERGYVCGYIGQNPALTAGWLIEAASAASANDAYLVDLTADESELKARMSKNARSRLKAWAKTGAEIVVDDGVGREAFLTLYPQTMERVGAGGVYRFTEATLRAWLDDPAVLTVSALRNGVVEAVSLFAHSADCGEYFFNAATEDGRDHAAALIWEGMRRLKARGVPVLNMGGGVARGDGLAKFKARFGGECRALIALRQVYDRARFDALCREAGVAADAPGFFPPYRVS